MIQRTVAQFAQSPDCTSEHLPFHFTPDVRQARAGSLGKLLELVRVVVRLLRIRAAGPIHLLLYPTGGPQRVPLLRDLLLLPWVFLCSRQVVLHFHAAGFAAEVNRQPAGIVSRAARWLYGKANAAVVMTEFNRRDPAAAGIGQILVVPHRIEDAFDPALVRRGDAAAARLLYVGHLCADKGTPQLLRAFAELLRKDPVLRLELVGECLPPFSDRELTRLLDELQIRSQVSTPGVLTGSAKQEAFGRADLFVFPSIAPYESFGLVLAEAMAWGLPIVATDWRGNAEVLTREAGAICFEATPPSLPLEIEKALAEAFLRREEWPAWGEANRRIFLQRYDQGADPQWLAGPILSLLA